MDRGDDPVDRGEHRGLEGPVVRDRRVLGGHAADRGVELVEGRWVIRSEIPAPRPQYGQSSSTITARWVLRIEASSVSRSSGRIVRRSITSASISSPASLLGGGERRLERARIGDQRDVGARAA